MDSELIRIVVLIDRYIPILGGAQNNVHELCKRLTNKNYHVTVLTRKIYSDMKSHELIDGISIRRLSYFPIRVISKIYCFFKIYTYLLINKADYDVVLCVPCAEYTDLMPAYVASFITNRPYVVRMTGLPAVDCLSEGVVRSVFSRIFEMFIPNEIRRRAINKADVVVAQSTVLRNHIISYYDTHCEVISNGVDLMRFNMPSTLQRNALKKNIRVPVGKILIINTGRYDAEKNQISLIKAAEEIETNIRPGQIHVLILGATQKGQVTSNADELRKYVSNNKIGYFVQFVDNADRVEDYLSAGDIFAHPTTAEGMSNALIEAMACGLPIVCSDIPQETCMFPVGVGFFHSPLDVETLVNHLVKLIDSSELRESYGKKLNAYALSNYSNDILSGKYAELFQRIISPK